MNLPLAGAECDGGGQPFFLVLRIAAIVMASHRRRYRAADGRQFVLYFGAGAAALFAGFVMMAGHASPSAAVITAVGTAIPAFVVARAWFNRSARAMSAKLSALADELARRLSDGRR